ncbi:MAG: S9 family peptidase [Marinilabiliales bacterium]|nr:S9 family peptidase [Marinilabiliales bacterium]
MPANLKGKLLIRHGDIDDNVHMQNTVWLVTTLQDLNKPFEMMIYPGERHGWGGPKRVFMTAEDQTGSGSNISLARKTFNRGSRWLQA